MAMNNSLAEVHPELVLEWSEKNLPLTPEDITFGSNKKVWWKGACGHEWQTSVKARSNGEKCPICSGARVIAGINDLPHLHQTFFLDFAFTSSGFNGKFFSDHSEAISGCVSANLFITLFFFI